MLIIGGGSLSLELSKHFSDATVLLRNQKSVDKFKKTILKDARDINEDDIRNYNIIIYTISSALNHDYKSEDATNDINLINHIIPLIKNNVKKFIYISSVAVYDEISGLEVQDTNFIKTTTNLYGKTKLTIEKLLINNLNPKILTIIRPSTIMYYETIHIGSMCDYLLNNDKIQMSSSYKSLDRNHLTPIPVYRVVEFIKYIIDQDFDNYQIFNISGDTKYSYNELFKIYNCNVKYGCNKQIVNRVVKSFEFPHSRNIAIILAAGSSTRFNGSKFSIKQVPKQYYRFGDKFLVEITTNKIYETKLFDEVILLLNSNFNLYNELLNINEGVKVVEFSSEHRFDSIVMGLKNISQQLNDNDNIVIFNGNDPYIYIDSILKAISMSIDYNIVAVGKDYSNDNVIIDLNTSKTIPREQLFCTQFYLYKYSLLRDITSELKNKYIMELEYLIDTCNEKIGLCYIKHNKLKITIREDIEFLNTSKKLFE